MSYIEKMCFVNWRFRSFVQYSFTVFSRDIKKKKRSEKSSENDQLTVHFQRVFFRAFFCPPDPKSEKKSRKSTYKKNLALEG